MSPITGSAGDVTVISDRPGRSMSGYAVLVGGFVLLIVAVYLGWVSLSRTSSSGLLAIVIFLLCVFVWKGLYVLQPNYSAVLLSQAEWDAQVQRLAQEFGVDPVAHRSAANRVRKRYRSAERASGPGSRHPGDHNRARRRRRAAGACPGVGRTSTARDHAADPGGAGRRRGHCRRGA